MRKIIHPDGIESVIIETKNNHCVCYCPSLKAIRNLPQKSVESTPFLYKGRGYIKATTYEEYYKYHKSDAFRLWYSLLCKTDGYATRKSYQDAVLSKEWYEFNNFMRFYEKNYKKDHVLDKDILVDGNMVYSESTCIFVPLAINSAVGRRSGTHYEPIREARIDALLAKYPDIDDQTKAKIKERHRSIVTMTHLRIKEILKEKQMQVGDLAKLIGIAPSNLSNIINERKKPSYDMLQKIATALEVGASELFVRPPIEHTFVAMIQDHGQMLYFDDKDKLREYLK